MVDTNVATTANGANDGAPQACMAASARALLEVMKHGHVFIDDGWRIISEYRARLSSRGQPGPGDAFFKWLLTHLHVEGKVTKVPITPRDGDQEDFVELPGAGEASYDRSDRKFLAVAAAHEERPPVLQSFDSKWWGWQESLAASGVRIHFLCAEAIAQKHAEKMET